MINGEGWGEGSERDTHPICSSVPIYLHVIYLQVYLHIHSRTGIDTITYTSGFLVQNIYRHRVYIMFKVRAEANNLYSFFYYTYNYCYYTLLLYYLCHVCSHSLASKLVEKVQLVLLDDPKMTSKPITNPPTLQTTL